MIVQSVLTPPSHASMLTGLTPPRHRVRLMYGTPLPSDVSTIAERLQHVGFDTVGSIDFDSVFRANQLGRGYRYLTSCDSKGAIREFVSSVEARRRAFLFLHLGDTHWPYGLGGKVSASHEVEIETAMQSLLGELGYKSVRSDKTTVLERAKDIRSQLEKLLKDPMELNDVFSSMYNLGVSFFDRLRFTEIIEQLSLLPEIDQKRTLLILTADHGEGLHEAPFLLDGGLPWFGHGLGLPRTVTEVPFCLATLAGPTDIPVVSPQSIDIAPTVLELLGIPADPSEFDGVNLLKHRRERIRFSESFQHLPIFWENMYKIAAFIHSGKGAHLSDWLNKMVREFEFSAQLGDRRLVEHLGTFYLEENGAQTMGLDANNIKLNPELDQLMEAIQMWKSPQLPQLGRVAGIQTQSQDSSAAAQLKLQLEALGYL